MKPIVVINLKTYKQGKKAVNLAEQLSKIDGDIILGVQSVDIDKIKRRANLKIFSQHVDWQNHGRATGFVLPESIKADKADGTFLNHSEHKLSFPVLKKTMIRCKELNLKTLIFVSSIKSAKKIKKLNPTYLVFEPPELVAGKISVSKAKPNLIKEFSKQLKYKFLVGAGIHSNEDVKIAMKLGASGVAISSSIVLAKNPRKKLESLLK